MRIVLATGNPGKIRELQELLGDLGAQIVPRSDFSSEDVAETGLSFIENALIKARHAARVSGLPAIADDSGIEVDALHAAPGIYSARYAGSGASDRDNLEKLLAELQNVADPLRGARYCCALVYMRHADDPFPIVCQASWEGRILREPRGTGGFGYDPIFWLDEMGLSAAELSAERKNQLSHRGQALRALVAELKARNELKVG